MLWTHPSIYPFIVKRRLSDGVQCRIGSSYQNRSGSGGAPVEVFDSLFPRATSRDRFGGAFGKEIWSLTRMDRKRFLHDLNLLFSYKGSRIRFFFYLVLNRALHWSRSSSQGSCFLVAVEKFETPWNRKIYVVFRCEERNNIVHS